MTQLRFVSSSLAGSAVLLASFFASLPAHAIVAAPGCSADADCQKGFECTVVGASGCASTPPCAPGAECPAPIPCEPTEYKECRPAHCEADADCADGMVCFDQPTNCVSTGCACAPDAPDCDCAVPACDPQPNKMCVPRYVPPCTEAADCGEGFSCEEQMSCTCSGSSGSDPGEPTPGAAPAPPGTAGAPAADAAPPADCSCESAGMRCVAKEITCTIASDCPTGWSCVTESVDVAEPAPSCTDADCGTGKAAPIPTRSVCQPEYYSGGGGDLDIPGTPTKGEDGSGTANGGTTPPVDSDSSEESNESSACQMGHAPASSGVLSILALVGAALGLKRRRRAA